MDTEDQPSADSFGSFARTPWPLKDIFWGIGILLSFVIIGYALKYSALIRYRPWIAGPIQISLWISFFVGMLLYSVRVCRKHGLWPLCHTSSASQIFKELARMFLVLLLICFVVGSIGILLSKALRTTVTIPKAWEWIRYGYNSFLLVAVLAAGFTVAPVVEEFFFRGFLYNALKTRLPLSVATIIQALIFSAIHRYGLFNSFLGFLMGIALAVVYEKRRNLLSPIFIHVMFNGVKVIPILILTLQNLHTPAGSWDEARTPPSWLKSYPLEVIERQETGIEQWQYAIDKWGSKGSRRWKIEVNAFSAVITWFPDDKIACAKAKLGIAHVYFYFLRDYRRAIIEANDLLSQYPEHKEQCASAFAISGWSHYMLQDFRQSRKAFDRVVSDFKEYKKYFEWSQKGIEWLDAIENRK